MHRRLVMFGVFWGTLGLAIALPSSGQASADARLFVTLASVMFPLCSFAAAAMARAGRLRAAGLLFVGSAATPTYFAAAVNVPALVIGLWLLVRPHRVLVSRLD